MANQWLTRIYNFAARRAAGCRGQLQPVAPLTQPPLPTKTLRNTPQGRGRGVIHHHTDRKIQVKSAENDYLIFTLEISEFGKHCPPDPTITLLHPDAYPRVFFRPSGDDTRTPEAAATPVIAEAALTKATALSSKNSDPMGRQWDGRFNTHGPLLDCPFGESSTSLIPKPS